MFFFVDVSLFPSGIVLGSMFVFGGVKPMEISGIPSLIDQVIRRLTAHRLLWPGRGCAAQHQGLWGG